MVIYAASHLELWVPGSGTEGTRAVQRSRHWKNLGSSTKSHLMDGGGNSDNYATFALVGDHVPGQVESRQHLRESVCVTVDWRDCCYSDSSLTMSYGISPHLTWQQIMVRTSKGAESITVSRQRGLRYSK